MKYTNNEKTEMKESRFFSIFKHKEEEKYLREMHRSGWKFTRVSGFGTYHFEKCEPEDVVYQLDYNPQTKKTLGGYIQLFADCGWEYIQQYSGYSYFRKPVLEMTGEEEIFNDDQSRAAMMSRVYKGRMFPLTGIFFAMLLPTFILSLKNGPLAVSVIYGVLILIYLLLFTVCAISHHKMKKK